LDISNLAELLEPSWGKRILAEAASEKDVSDTEARLGLNLPQSLRDAYMLANGEIRSESMVRGRYYAGIFFGRNFLSLKQLERSLIFWRELLISGDLAGQESAFDSKPLNHVRATAYDTGWLPFADESNERPIAIDNNPLNDGVAGQIINFGVDDLTRFSLSPSFNELVDTLHLQYIEKKCHPFLSGEHTTDDELFSPIVQL